MSECPKVFYCIERRAGDPPHFYPARQPTWRRRYPGNPWVTNIDEAAQYETREAAQAALEAENWHVDPSAGVRVTEHAYVST